MENNEQIIKKIKNGDVDSFSILFKNYKDEAFRYVYLITKNREISEDIVQESFILCFRNIKKLKNPDKFKSWFFKILTRTSWKALKTNSRVIPVENIYEKIEDSDISNYIAWDNENYQTEILKKEINNLGVKQRTIIVLYYYKELSIKEIAEITGCFEGTVKSRLYNARKKLKISLERNKGDE